MARIPNPHADQTAESLIRNELENGNIPLACGGDDCSAVTGVSPSRALRLRGEPQSATGRCEYCGGSFEAVDLDG